MKIIWMVLGIAVIGFCTFASGAVVSEDVQYEAGGVSLKGYLVYDDAVIGPRPGVIVVHEWWGLNEYARHRARMLAQLGYTAFAIDMYGEGKNTVNPNEAEEFAKAVRNDMPAARARFNAALDVIKKHKMVIPDKIAAIGYCFGGGIVLQMALDGTDLDGVVSFHATLGETYPESKPQVKAKILICHGADDPYANASQVEQFQKELNKASADWQMNIYSKAVHSFTNPASGDDPSKGVAYNKEADMRSWEALKLFFKEIFS